jgi:uncharacterized protein (DUF927 family)
MGWQDAARRNPPAAVSNSPNHDTSNTGILCDSLRVIDVDVDDPKVAPRCVEIARAMFGNSPMRYRDNSPRRLLVYRAAAGEPEKRKIEGTAGKIEALGHGQQFVAFGDHESGADLQWDGDAPGSVSRDGLTAVTEDQITLFFEAVSPIIGSKSPPPKKGGKKKRADSVDQTELLRRIVAGEAFHDSVLSLAGYFASRSVPLDAAVAAILAAFDAVPGASRDARWQERRDDAERCVRDIYAKDEERRKPQGPAGIVMPKFYEFNEHGLFYQPPPKNDGPATPLWVCAPFEIMGRTSDTTHLNHGLYFRWIDLDEDTHTWACPMSRVHSDSGELTGDLHAAGLRCGTSRGQRDALRTFLTTVVVTRRVICVDRAGWHDKAFVLPSGDAFGPGAGNIVLQTESAAGSSAFIARGTIGEWKEKVAKYAVGNDLMVLAICCALMGPLLDIINEPTSGFHIYGQSQTGKTTQLFCAMSVWGPGDERHKVSWRSTDNALEAVAAARNGGFLPLDELGLLMSRFAATMGYILGIGVGKNRARRDGLARRPLEWTLAYLSTGETTFAARAAEAGERTRAGMDVRLIELSADAGAGMGVWQKLHDFKTAAALAEHLRVAATAYCGTAAPAFLSKLAHDRAEDQGALQDALSALKNIFLKKHVPTDADGQVRSVAARFSILAAAGELATVYGILPWNKGEALRATEACFKKWLVARGGVCAGEDIRAVEQVRSAISAHGGARFEVISENADADNAAVEMPPERIANRMGFKRWNGTEWEYLVLPDAWKNEVCAGLDPRRVARVLIERDLLRCEQGRLTIVRRLGKYGNVRGYAVRGAILEGEDGGEDGGVSAT